ncbi:MAG: hypothetical protein DYH15_13005 [Nitrosomonas sp. PRO4]|nr:hypothetical protein [Nitrosomonas sp. PRO4]
MRTLVKAFLPIDITDDMLLSSTIPEPHPDEPEWDSAVTYAEGASVSVITTNNHLVYESLQSGNTNHPPATSDTWWILRSYTNRFRMFNWYQGRPSVGQSPMTVVIRPKKRINALVLEGLKTSGLEVVIRNGIDGPVAFTIHAWLLSRQVSSFYDFFFAPFTHEKIVSTFAIPPIPDPVISVTLSDQSGVCELGRFGVGFAIGIGEVEWNTVSEDGAYSDIEFDKSGWPTLKPTKSLSTLDMKLDLEAIRINAVTQFKKSIEGKPVFWSAMESLEAYRQMHVKVAVPEKFIITSENHKQATVDLRLKGI